MGDNEKSEGYRKYLDRYIKKGMKVAEFYYGNREDILKELKERVGERGVVIGVDQYALGKTAGVNFIAAVIPNVPLKDESLDSVIVRGWLFTLKEIKESKGGIEYGPDEDFYREINRIIKEGGTYILLSEHGKFDESEKKLIINQANKYLKNFKIVEASDDGIIFEKVPETYLKITEKFEKSYQVRNKKRE